MRTAEFEEVFKLMTPLRLRMLIAFGAAALFAPLASAQRYNFKFYGEEEGLKNLGVQAVLQDRAGFLWAGNWVLPYIPSHQRAT